MKSSNDTETTRFIQKVYTWMFFGLIISGLTAYLVSLIPELYKFIVLNRIIFYLLFLIELGLVFSLVKWIKKMPAKIAVLLFFLYSFTTGLTLSVIFLVFTIQSIGLVFFITALMFGAMSLYGYYTKRDLTGFGQLLLMALFGMILAIFANFFLNNSVLDYILSIIGVIVFTGLTAYDTQKIKKSNILGNEGTEEDTKESIIGALELYLDFVNLFLDLLRLLGKRR